MKESHRDRRSVRWIDNLLRFPLRLILLLRDRGFAAVAIGVMALGIGANAAMFSLVDAVLLKPLPFPSPTASSGSRKPRPRRRATASAPSTSRLEAAEHVVRGDVGDEALERRRDRRG